MESSASSRRFQPSRSHKVTPEVGSQQATVKLAQRLQAVLPPQGLRAILLPEEPNHIATLEKL
jgi:hypothetical protein